MTHRAVAVLIAVGLGLNLGCRPHSPEGASSTPPLLGQYHFVGASQLATNLNAARLRSIWDLPATRRLADEALGRLAHVPQGCWGVPGQPFDPATTALARPLLDDMLDAESYGEWHGQTNHLAEWTLALRLKPERARLWETNCWRLVLACRLGTPVATRVQGFPAWETRDPRSGERFRLVRAGEWTVFGAGSDDLLGQADLLGRIRVRRSPATNLGDNWLEAAGQVAWLEPDLPVAASSGWPTARLNVWGQDKDLRLRLALTFPGLIRRPAGPWQLPTGLIRAPLVSFTALRGIAPWVGQLAWVSPLHLSSAPDQLFVWAQQSRLPMQTFVAVPLADATNAVAAIALRLRDALAPELVRHNMGQIRWVTNRTELNWIGLPFIQPSLRAVREPAGQFLFGGLFQPLPSTNPPPPQLMAQIAGRSNLVYYDWELTGERLIHWRALEQLHSIIAAFWRQGETQVAGHPPAGPPADPLPDANAPTQMWLQAVAPLLGNTITRGNLIS
ncbi:MAG: hypothetical protein KGS61_12245, partial [Verrucomicrobia bacterium]|nr:hypothetical protein [Verrucomicrobiota bacterium]